MIEGHPTRDLAPDELKKLWRSLGIDDANAETVGLTISPDIELNTPIESLPRLLEGKAGAPPILVISEKIAEGGMANIYRARQTPLGRDVAIKALKRNAGIDQHRHQLLHEGRIAGGLEHPNIVPIHALGVDTEGEPLLVMKRIKGISWAEFMHAPDDRAERLTGETDLERNLDVLIQVARAVEFAHQQGVVHRDLKPDNVMIGNFGEVYLLDWGIALRLCDGEAQITGVAGTPGYMAPEMVHYYDRPITPQTDVYLLGATLFHLLCGQPPHQSKSVYAAMLKSARGQPKVWPEETPRGLVAICERAMNSDPSLRFPSAEAFRYAVAEWLRHRASRVVWAEAQERLTILRVRIEEGTGPGTIYRDFGAARFGFEQAMRIWTGNVAAKSGLTEALRVMTTYELKAGNAPAAEALLADLAGLDAEHSELRDALTQLQAQSHAANIELAALRAFERDMDPHLGTDTRSLVALGLGTVMALQCLATRSFVHYVTVQPWHYLAHQMLLVAVTVIAIRAGRNGLLLNRFSRQISHMFLLMFVGGLGLRAVIAASGSSFFTAFPYEMFSYSVGIAMTGVATSQHLVWSAVPMAIGAIGMAYWPHWQFEIATLGILLTSVGMAVGWHPRFTTQDSS